MKKIIREKIGNISNVSAGGDKPKKFSITKSNEYSVPVIANGVDNNGIVGYTDVSTIKGNAVTVAARGSVGEVLYQKDDYYPIIRLISIEPFSNRLDAKYLFYYLKKYKLSGTGSVQKQLTVPQVFDHEITIFDDLNYQKRVSKVLNVLDRKIENNERISSELERLAKTIYDYWFLQFEFPNEEGKPYKTSGGKMVYNKELKREIPDGWKVSPIKDCIKHINTGLNPRDNFVLNDKKEVKYITVKNLTTEGRLDFSGCDYISFKTKELVNRRSQIQKGDILFASIAPLGRCYLIEETPKDWEINESVFSIRPDLNIISAEYLYMFFMSDWFIKKAEHSSTGSVFSGIRVSVLEDTKILVPDEVTTRRFSAKASSIMNAKFNKEKENQQLASLRDWLLPMLMNGQVTFKENGSEI